MLNRTVRTADPTWLAAWKEAGYVDPQEPNSCWVDFGKPGGLPTTGGVDYTPIPRPPLPDVTYPYMTAEATRLYFGRDYVALKQPISWITFERNERWLWLLIDAARSLASLFEASEGIMMSDCSPAACEIANDKSFADLMAAPFLPEFQEWGRIRPIEDFPTAAKTEDYTERDYWKFL